VLELVGKGSLKTLLRGPLAASAGAGGAEGTSAPAISWRTKMGWAADVAMGMAYIHSLKQMHRDLKSGNILITHSDRAKIADFGTIRQLIAKKAAGGSASGSSQGRGGGGGSSTGVTTHSHGSHGSSSVLNPVAAAAGAASAPKSGSASGNYSAGEGSAGAGQNVHVSGGDADVRREPRSGEVDDPMEMTAGKGTPLYMSPEVIRGRQYNQSADVWSYGVVLWEIAAQRSPDLLAQEGNPMGPSLYNLRMLLADGKRLTLEPSWPHWFAALITQCWLADVTERPKFDEIVRIVEDNLPP
jgi:LRR receptor-like serine/threonine-protein kinase FLS2